MKPVNVRRTDVLSPTRAAVHRWKSYNRLTFVDNHILDTQKLKETQLLRFQVCGFIIRNWYTFNNRHFITLLHKFLKKVSGFIGGNSASRNNKRQIIAVSRVYAADLNTEILFQ